MQARSSSFGRYRTTNGRTVSRRSRPFTRWCRASRSVCAGTPPRQRGTQDGARPGLAERGDSVAPPHPTSEPLGPNPGRRIAGSSRRRSRRQIHQPSSPQRRALDRRAGSHGDNKECRSEASWGVQRRRPGGDPRADLCKHGGVPPGALPPRPCIRLHVRRHPGRDPCGVSGCPPARRRAAGRRPGCPPPPTALARAAARGVRVPDRHRRTPCRGHVPGDGVALRRRGRPGGRGRPAGAGLGLAGTRRGTAARGDSGLGPREGAGERRLRRSRSGGDHPRRAGG